MPKYPTIAELKLRYSQRDAAVQALSQNTVINVHDIAILDRHGRFLVACDLWSRCDEIARGALLSDEHAHVRSAAKLSGEQYQREVAEALGFGSVSEMKAHQDWLKERQCDADLAKKLIANAGASEVIDLRPLWSQAKNPA